jgi:2-desacetyl-2-hydroxyethyl bacteriochlorophyllide A dehydrogenase
MAIVRESSRDGLFRAGDRVTVEPTLFCGTCAACRSGHSNVCQQLRLLGIDQDGAFQEFWAVPEHRLHKLPDGVSDDHAAMVEPMAVAVHDVRLAAVRAGETAAVIGGGTIGLFIAHLARRAGARVFVLETNPFRREFARRQQFDVLDPGQQDAPALLADASDGAGMSVVFEASGSVAGARLMTSVAAVRGRIVVVGIHGHETVTDLFQVFFRELSIQGARAYARSDFEEAIRLIASGEINLDSMISKRCRLEGIQETLDLAITGMPVMKLMVDFGGGDRGKSG